MNCSRNFTKKILTKLQKQEILIEKLSSDLDVLKEKLNDSNKLLKFNTDRQYYFNAFANPELLKIAEYPGENILLCGNYGNPNTGDEWMLDTMIEYLRKYSNKQITIMLEPNRIFDPSVYLKYNIEYIHYPQTIYDYDIIVDKFDILIFGGGAIIEDNVYYEAYDYGVNICRTVVDLPLRFIYKNKKVLCIGLSTSTFLTNADYISKLNTVINKATYFSVRDSYSLDVLQHAGICTDNVNLIHDIVYANSNLLKTVQENRIKEFNYTTHIGIVYIVSDENKEAFFHLISLIKNDMENQGKKYTITLIPFYDCWHIDYKFYIDAQKYDDNIEVVPFNSDIQSMIEIFMKQDIMICARYHAMLLSFCLNIPCVGLYYDSHQHYYNKISYLLEQFGFCLNDCIALTELKTYQASVLDKVLYNFDINVELILKEAQIELDNILDNNI